MSLRYLTGKQCNLRYEILELFQNLIREAAHQVALSQSEQGEERWGYNYCDAGRNFIEVGSEMKGKQKKNDAQIKWKSNNSQKPGSFFLVGVIHVY